MSRRLTQEECAAKAEIATVYLSGLERGVRNPTVTGLRTMSQDRFNFQHSIFKSRFHALMQLLTLVELGGCCQLLGYLCL
ncbi:MAG: helix-turn-helix domain-containing protein [Candidatus Obscuribacterales bacterium]|nr:helix-turn-helix domain-containing protein [Candidatus Obscuribacterales bacterium]